VIGWIHSHNKVAFFIAQQGVAVRWLQLFW